MKVELKVENGRVNCLMRTGRDLVKDSVSETAARGILEDGKELTKSEIADYPIEVNHKWLFEGTIIEEKVKKKEK